MNSNNKMSGWMNPDFISETEKNHKVFFNKNIKKIRGMGNIPKEVNGETLTDSEVIDFLVDTTRINVSVYRDLLTIVSDIIDDGDDIVLDTLREIHGLKHPDVDHSLSDDDFSLYGWMVYLFEIQNIMENCLIQLHNPVDVNHYRSILTNIYTTISTIGDVILSNYSSNDNKSVTFYHNLLTFLLMDNVITLNDMKNHDLRDDSNVMSYVNDIVKKMKDEPIISLYMVLSHYNENINTCFSEVIERYSPDNRENNLFHQFCWDNIYKTIPGLHDQVFVHDWTNKGLDIVGKFQVKMDQLLHGEVNSKHQLDIIRYDKSIIDQVNNQMLSSFKDKIDNSSDEELMKMGLIRK